MPQGHKDDCGCAVCKKTSKWKPQDGSKCLSCLHFDGTPESCPLLIDLVRHPNPKVRADAVFVDECPAYKTDQES